MKKHPETMILVAVIVALVAGIICLASTCSQIGGLVTGMPGAQSWIIDEIQGDDDGSSEGISGIGGNYGEDDVPDSMEIETDELTSDLQTCINYDITDKLGLSESDQVTVSDLTKDDVGTPTLVDGNVLCQVSGTVTITNMLGQTETTGYTSYYYADDPTADKITWYIYGYDLDSYQVLPSGLEDVAGDPMDIRDMLQDGSSSASSRLGALLGGGQDA